ncbi:HNH endonuclease [Staphylococcus rostri]|uniref:HNH endonuclease n=1 Tax=Staphylococcus aureus TaxID=1280 RepID=UPI0013F65D26|nr:HNH endonuclease [Staphylococcus aureus]NHF54672.1 HNH endonuclease [Staphylococcus aureus]
MARSIPKSFYKGSQWLKCRDSYMSKQNYICERCGGLATICHHTIHLNSENYKNPYVAYNHDLLEALCHDCHNQEHFGSPTIGEGLRFDENGNIVKV